MQLDESTLAVVASGTHADVAPADGTITIGVWQGTTVPYSADQYGSEIWFGNKVAARNVSPNAPAPGTGNPTTNLHGWIQPASGSADATWVDSDMLTLDTRAQGSSPTTNTMDVGGTAYTSSLPAGATGGFQLLVLDNAGQPTVYPITGDPDETQANEDRLAAKVNEAAKNEVTILVPGLRQRRVDRFRAYDASDGSANGYSATDFATAQQTYEGEIADDGADGVDADTIAQKIQAQLFIATQPVTDNTYDVMQGALTALSGVPDVGTPAAYLAGLFAMGSAILPNTSGDPSLPNQVELTQANAAASITQYYKAASNQLGTFGDYISGHWEWQAPNQPAGMYHWWMGVNYSSKPDLWMMRPNPGLPGTITDPLFTPVDASKAPSQQTAIGAVMPYFALTYLPFKSVDILSNPDTQERGCYG